MDTPKWLSPSQQKLSTKNHLREFNSFTADMNRFEVLLAE